MNQKHILAYILFTCLSIANAQCRLKLSGHGDAPLIKAEFSTDGSMIAACTEDNLIYIWDGHFDEPPLIRVQGRLRKSISSIAFAPNSQLLALGYTDGYVEIRKIDPFNRKLELINYTQDRKFAHLTSLAFKDNENLFIATTDEEESEVWKYDLGKCKRQIIFRDTYPIKNIQCSPSGKSLYVIRRTDLEILREENEFKSTLLIKDKGKRLIEGKRISIMYAEGDEVIILCADFSKVNENKFLLVSPGGTIHIQTFGMNEFDYIFGYNAVYAQFSPVDHRILLIADKGKTQDALYLMKPFRNNGKPYHIIDDGTNLEGRVTSARFNHNGTKVMATLDTGEVIIWDIPQRWDQTLENLYDYINKNYYCIVQ